MDMRNDRRIKFCDWYEAHIERWIPSYALLSLIGCLVWNCMIYWGTQQTILGLGLHTHDITSAIDLMVPFRPEWVLIYVLSFPFWAVSYILTAKENTRDDWFRFVFADMLAKAICGVIFIAFPTTNVRPDIDGSGILGSLGRKAFQNLQGNYGTCNVRTCRGDSGVCHLYFCSRKGYYLLGMASICLRGGRTAGRGTAAAQKNAR